MCGTIILEVNVRGHCIVPYTNDFYFQWSTSLCLLSVFQFCKCLRSVVSIVTEEKNGGTTDKKTEKEEENDAFSTIYATKGQAPELLLRLMRATYMGPRTTQNSGEGGFDVVTQRN